MEAQNNRQKREQIHKLRRRNADLAQEHKKLSEHNANIERKIVNIEEEIARFRRVNVDLAEKIETELLKERTFKAAIVKIEGEVQNLEQTYAYQKARYEKKSVQTEQLERELEKLSAKKRAYAKYTRLASGNEKALELRTENIKEQLLVKHQELKAMEGGEEAPVSRNSLSLEERFKRLAGKNLKEGSALFHCVKTIIKNMEENEFEGLSYKVRINKNKHKLGARIYFHNVSSQYSDLKEHLKPVVLKLGSKFKIYGAQIETRAKKSSNGIVRELDITFIVNLPALVKGALHTGARAL